MKEHRRKWVAENKDTEVYRPKTRETARRNYENNKQKVLDRMKNYHDA